MKKTDYSFLNEFDFETSLKRRLLDNNKSIFELCEDLLSECDDVRYFIDTVPKRMSNNIVYSKFFDIFYGVNDSTDIECNFKNNFYKFKKLTSMLVGYSENCLFESSVFYNKDNFDSINLDNLNLEYSINTPVVLNTTNNIDLFEETLDASLNDKAELIIYCVDLKMILCVNGLFIDCLIFDNIKFIKEICVTEGLYCYKPS